MKDTMLQGIADAKRQTKDNNWYYVPPYKGADQKVVNESGELIAIFEQKEDALLTVKLHNESVK